METIDSIPLEEYCRKENVIGNGGYGQVYRGKWRNTQVAIKRLEKKDQQKVAEIELQVRLRHENILGCLEATWDNIYRLNNLSLICGIVKLRYRIQPLYSSYIRNGDQFIRLIMAQSYYIDIH